MASEGDTDHFYQASREQQCVFGKGFQIDVEVKMTLPVGLSNTQEPSLKSPSVKVAACVNLLTPPCHRRTPIRMAVNSGQHVYTFNMHVRVHVR